jgi:hypothetical protein
MKVVLIAPVSATEQAKISAVDSRLDVQDRLGAVRPGACRRLADPHR